MCASSARYWICCSAWEREAHAARRTECSITDDYARPDWPCTSFRGCGNVNDIGLRPPVTLKKRTHNMFSVHAPSESVCNVAQVRTSTTIKADQPAICMLDAISSTVPTSVRNPATYTLGAL